MARHIKNLNYKDKPDYTYMKNILEDMLAQMGEDFDRIYDWMLLPPVEYPKDFASSLIMKLNVIPYEEKFLK
jgi:hypothetical protein